MNNNDQLFELITKMYGEMQEGFKGVNERLDKIENKIDDIESNNADRHVLIGGDIRKIKASLSKVEIITADNWGDIARLKAKRKHKI